MIKKSLTYFGISTIIFFNAFDISLASDTTRGEVFEAIGNSIDTPTSSQYIDLFYKDINNTDTGYAGLQKLVYTEKLENAVKNVFPNTLINQAQLYALLTHVADKNIETIEYLKGSNTIAQSEDLENLDTLFGELQTVKINIENTTVSNSKDSNIDEDKLEILNDIYDSLNANHFDSDSFDNNQLIDSAIEGLANGTDDPYTSYFPPAENTNFQESLQGEFEGIGAYVDMLVPGMVTIISAISGSPAEKALLRGGDIITSVDGRVVEKTDTLTDITTLIKGPAGTDVNLGILRGEEELIITVTRGKIIIKDVETKKISASTFYIQMKLFSSSVASEFTKALDELNAERSVRKVVIDLRSNPGGYLDQVVDILGHFVEEGEDVAVVKYKESERRYESYGYDVYDFSDKEIMILVNSGTASAAEILAGTLKDYFPDRVTIIGEQTFGKGSVQTQRAYKDGSALKYTIARWYTGKTEIGIEGIGIEPDTILPFDQELWEKRQIDNQFEEAIK